MIVWSLSQDKPAAIRYGKSMPEGKAAYTSSSFVPGRWEKVKEGADACIAAVGGMVRCALNTADILEKEGIHAAVMNASSVWPLDEGFLTALSSKNIPLFTMEENERTGGFGSTVTAYCQDRGLILPRHVFALSDAYLPHGSRDTCFKRDGLDPKSVADLIRRMI